MSCLGFTCLELSFSPLYLHFIVSISTLPSNREIGKFSKIIYITKIFGSENLFKLWYNLYFCAITYLW